MAAARLPIVFRLTAALTREGAGYVAQCLEVDVASEGETLPAALRNLRQALELFFDDGDQPPGPPVRLARILVRVGGARARSRARGLHDDDFITRLTVIWCDRCARAVNTNEECHFHAEQCGCCRMFRRIDTDWGWCKQRQSPYCGRRVFEHDTCASWVEGRW